MCRSLCWRHPWRGSSRMWRHSASSGLRGAERRSLTTCVQMIFVSRFRCPSSSWIYRISTTCKGRLVPPKPLGEGGSHRAGAKGRRQVYLPVGYPGAPGHLTQKGFDFRPVQIAASPLRMAGEEPSHPSDVEWDVLVLGARLPQHSYIPFGPAGRRVQGQDVEWGEDDRDDGAHRRGYGGGRGDACRPLPRRTRNKSLEPTSVSVTAPARSRRRASPA